MKPRTTDDHVNMVFRELFNIDSEGNITGLTGNLDLTSAIDDYFEEVVLDVLQCIESHDGGQTYPRLLPWVEATREAILTRHEWREDDPCMSPYGVAMLYLCAAYARGRYKIAYPEALVRAAIESNFDDDDPRKTILLRCLPHGRPSERTEMSKWKNRNRLDCRKEFTAESVAGMKPALLEYLEDLKDLGEAPRFSSEPWT